jgi:hypothetical protein
MKVRCARSRRCTKNKRGSQAADLWQRLEASDGTPLREHHLLVAAAQASARSRRPRVGETAAQERRKSIHETAHFFAAAAELAAARGNHRRPGRPAQAGVAR